MRRNRLKQFISAAILLISCAAIMIFTAPKYLNEFFPGFRLPSLPKPINIAEIETQDTEPVTSADTTAQTTAEVTEVSSEISTETSVDVTDFETQDETDGENTELLETASTVKDVESIILPETKAAGTDYLKRIIFIGDILTSNMGTYKYSGIPDPQKQVWGVDTGIPVTKIDRVNNFIYPETYEDLTFKDAIKRKKPQYVVIAFGSYCEEGTTDEQFKRGIHTFITSLKKASPSTGLIIQSILPTAEGSSVLSPIDVMRRNELIKQLCTETAINVYYLDVWSALSDDNGVLLDEYKLPEDASGYLLNEQGYQAVINYVETHAHPNYVIH